MNVTGMIFIVIFVVAWLILGFIGAGWLYSSIQFEFDSAFAKRHSRSDCSMACYLSLFGPITLVVGFFFSGFAQHGCWRSNR